MKEDHFRREIEPVPDQRERGLSSDYSEDDYDGPNAQEYYDWRELYPQLQVLIDNYEDILQEAEAVTGWHAWPEYHFREGGNNDWKVFPFAYCFPADDESRLAWVEKTCSYCPKTVEVLKQIPGLRTALFSRLGPGTRLSTHTGWEDLANHVLRAHLGLRVPPGGRCGLWVEGKVELHEARQINVFDDSKRHKAFNDSAEERLVLIVDLARP
ncbi:unnamed protein product, partial [Heterosigma akashiwo]